MGNCNFKKINSEKEQTQKISKNLFIYNYVIGKGGYSKVKKKLVN